MEAETGKELWSPGDLMNTDEFRKFDKHCRVLQVTTLTEKSGRIQKVPKMQGGVGGAVRGVRGKHMRNIQSSPLAQEK